MGGWAGVRAIERAIERVERAGGPPGNQAIEQ